MAPVYKEEQRFGIKWENTKIKSKKGVEAADGVAAVEAIERLAPDVAFIRPRIPFTVWLKRSTQTFTPRTSGQCDSTTERLAWLDSFEAHPPVSP